MLELGYETISGTPGTTAAITVASVSSPVAYPRLSDVGPLGAPIHYTIEDSTGLVLETGVGISTAAGSFTRIAALTQWGGSSYTTAPSGLYSLPASCIIYCSMSGFAAIQAQAITCNISANRWYEPAGLAASSSTWTPTAANRDHIWRTINRMPYKVDAIAIHASGTVSADIGIYTINASTGKPAKLLLGWKNASLVSGMNTLTLASRTDGVMSAAAASLPTGPLAFLYNTSSAAVTCNRVVSSSEANFGGSETSDLSGSQHCLYGSRTQGNAMIDDPSLTGRLTSGTMTSMPMIAFRGV